MTPIELEQRCRHAYNQSAPAEESLWDDTSPQFRQRLLGFAAELLRDLDTYRQTLLRIHQFAQPIVEWTEPVFRQEIRRRELEPPQSIRIDENLYQFDPKKWEELTGRSWDNWLRQEAEREAEQKR